MLCMDVHVWLVLWLSRSVLTTHLHARVHSHSLVLLCTCVLLHASCGCCSVAQYVVSRVVERGGESVGVGSMLLWIQAGPESECQEPSWHVGEHASVPCVAPSGLEYHSSRIVSASVPRILGLPKVARADHSGYGPGLGRSWVWRLRSHCLWRCRWSGWDRLVHCLCVRWRGARRPVLWASWAVGEMTHDFARAAETHIGQIEIALCHMVSSHDRLDLPMTWNRRHGRLIWDRFHCFHPICFHCCHRFHCRLLWHCHSLRDPHFHVRNGGFDEVAELAEGSAC